MKTKLRREGGSALLIALCLMAMLTLAAIAALNTANTDIELSYNQSHSEKAFYIAEAGAKRAVAELRNDKTWSAGFTNVSFGEGVYSVTVIDSASDSTLFDTIIVTGTAEAGGGDASIELEVVPEYLYPFKYAMFAESEVDIRNSMLIDSYNSDSGSYFSTKQDMYGDVGSNENIFVYNGAQVGGGVATALDTGLHINPGATVTGDTTSTAPETHLPPIPADEFLWASTNNDNATGISGSYSINGSGTLSSSGNVVLSDGVYYFNDIILTNSAVLSIAPGAEVTVYVTGDIEMKNSSSMNPTGDPADLTFYSQGDFVLKNSGDIRATFYSPTGDADLRNSGDFYGSIAAGTIVCHNSAGFHYDRKLGKIKKGETGNMLVVAWREL